MRKAAIEHASVGMLEVFERVSDESRREKRAVPPINKMIYYWTRKPLIVGRAVALACTLEKPENVKELLGFNKTKHTNKKRPASYKLVPDRIQYKGMLDNDPSNITVLDPFAGTGNLAFSSAELGMDVTCSDYNPLAYLISRGSLEIPSRFDSGLAKEFENAANSIIGEVENEVGRFYTARKLAYLWAWCIRCTHCNQRIPLLNQMYLSKPKKVGLRFIPTQDKDFVIELVEDISEKDGRSFTQRRGKAQCISCGNTIGYTDMTQDIAKNKDKEMVAIQIQKSGRQGRGYVLPSIYDKEQYDKSVQYLSRRRSKIMDLIPQENILASHRKRNTLWIYGIKRWNEFFNCRQLLILSTLVQKIEDFCKTSGSPHTEQLRVYLAFLVAKLVDNYSYGVRWHTSRDIPANALSMRQPRIVFNLAEINPFEKVAGSLRNNVNGNIVKAMKFCARLKNPVSCRMESVTAPSHKQYDLIITDPPYSDDVQYGEMSEFFYLWVRRILKDESLPKRAPLDEDFCESWGRFGDKKLASEFFEKGLKKSFVSLNSKLKDDGLLAVFFAHSSIKAWNQLLLSLRAGGFRVVSSYALHTENTENLLARNKTSFMFSIVVTCRKIADDSSGFMEDIIPDTEDGIRDILENVPTSKLLTLPITDLLVMVYGKVLESCTQYRTLKSRSGDMEPNFENLLFNAQSVVMRLLVSKLTKSSMNAVGPRMAFYIFAKVFQGGKVSADDMLKITKAFNIEPSVLMGSCVVVKKGSAYKIPYLHQNEMDFPPENVARDNLHQQLCYLARQVDTGKAKSVDIILDRENFIRPTLKQIVYLIVQSINMRKNRGESLDESDREELGVLNTLADIMGVRSEDGLDVFGDA